MKFRHAVALVLISVFSIQIISANSIACLGLPEKSAKTPDLVSSSERSIAQVSLQLKNRESIGVWECKHVTEVGLKDLKSHLGSNVFLMTDKLVNGPIDKSFIEILTDR
ncbi:MAG: hypothetical protein K8F91_01130 [Candidatus Obscuribacterales bacterium]|nr:hypothetical protein [Candidatus Obscuribacterales bacterium]